jgi:hypothetical protein
MDEQERTEIIEQKTEGFDDNGEVGEEPAKNLLDQLREERRQGMEDMETLIPVPGYEQIPLLIQYRMMDGHEMDKIGRKVVKQSRDRWTRNLMAAIDVMISAATGVFVEMGGEVQPLTYNREPITGYTPELAEALNFQANTAREVVIGVFQNKDMHIANHSMRLQRWFGDSTTAVDEEFLGE